MISESCAFKTLLSSSYFLFFRLVSRLSARCELLINIVNLHIDKNKGDSPRILVFVNMRRTAKKLHSCLMHDRQISARLNPQVRSTVKNPDAEIVTSTNRE